MKHDICRLLDIGPRTLRAWGRIIAMNTDCATDAELRHALRHFEAVREHEGRSDSIDDRFVAMIEDEQAHRAEVYA